jgi:hypothetical protein
MALTPLGQAVDGILDRLVVLEPLALPTTKDAVKHFFHTQATWPYWTHRFDGLVPRERSGQSVLSYDLSLVLRLVYGHLASDFKGTVAQTAVVDAADVVGFFTRHHRLAVESDPALRQPPRWIGGGIVISAGAQGIFSPIDSIAQIGIEFRMTIPITVSPQ